MIASSFEVINEDHDSLIAVEFCKEIDPATVEVSIDGAAVRMDHTQLLETAKLFENMAKKVKQTPLALAIATKEAS